MRAQRAFIVGALLRRAFRRACDRMAIHYTEDKGWLDSQFIVTGDSRAIDQLAEAFRETDS